MKLPFNFPVDLRDKRNLMAGGILLAALLFLLVVAPLNNKSKELDKKLAKIRENLTEIATLSDSYIALSARLPKRSKTLVAGKSMSAEVEGLTRKLGMEKNIKRMTPKFDTGNKRQEELSITISGLPLASLADFLEKLYSLPVGINVRRARIKAGYEQRGDLDVELTLVPSI